jgi:Leucine-rich repeat (LRR) protein
MCKIDNEYCSCELYNGNIVMSLNCKENSDQEFIQNVTQLKRDYVLKEIVELYLENKLIKNISNPNVKEMLSNKLVSLSIGNCKVQSINKGIFNQMPNLKNMSLSRNEIDSIELNSFLNKGFQSNILELYLSMNKLTKIKSGQFKGLINLEKLFTDKNEIQEIELNSFEDMNKLILLNIQSNKIKVIQDNLLHNKIDLDILYLYQNSIESIESISFNTLRKLRKLHLFSNKITRIAFGNFIHLQSLDEIKLDKNEIGSFGANTFVGLENLTFLDLSANKIKKLVDRGFNGLKSVSKLELDLNDINQIEMNSFADLSSLDKLNLDSNQISSLKNVQFNANLTELSLRLNFISNLSEIRSTSLKRLYISKNRIQEINSVTHLPNLEYLDLSQNRLISLKEISFSALNSLKYLNLSGNRLDLESDSYNISYFKNQTSLETLDLSSNLIKNMSSKQTFLNLNSLKSLNLSNNKLNLIKPFLFEFLYQLNDLNLAANNLSRLFENCFLNLHKLQILKLSFNRLNSTNFLRDNRNYTKNLKSLELDYNLIEFIRENDFEFNRNLTHLNLNSNPIKSIHKNALGTFRFLTSLRLSNTSINVLFLNRSESELDLSYLSNGSIIMNRSNLRRIEWINLANTKVNISFDLFLSNSTRFVDYSYNSFTFSEFKMFNILGPALETLKLAKTNLQQIEKINLKKLLNLKHLDLSFNNLSEVSPNAFEISTNLEYLDLSSNRICEFNIVLKKLRYLNLDNNQIFSTSQTLFDFFSIETFKMANNQLQMYPSFEMSQIDSQSVETFIEIDLNKNQLNQIKYFSFIFGKLKMANFDTNNISSIEIDAFLNCRSLEYLSIANNRLKSIRENYFHFLFSLIHLNLSYNEIEFIENSSFKNLNKLKTLDLNYNKLVAIQNDLFLGLESLKDLHLMMMTSQSSANEMNFTKASFKHLPNISSIYLNERLIVKYKCIFMHEMERDVQRNVSNMYIFYKSINLISENVSFNGDDEKSLKSKCDLVFHLFQFKLHFNLKTDYENDLFFDSCEKVLIERENSFNHNGRKCSQTFVFKDKDDIESVAFVPHFLLVLSNFYFLLTMAAFISLLGPAFCLIFRYELCSSLISYLCKDSLTEEEKFIKELELEIKRKEEIIQKNLSNYQKDESDLFYLKKKCNKLKLQSTHNNVSTKSNKINSSGNLGIKNPPSLEPLELKDLNNGDQNC